jgi:hypothetical protein
MKLNVIPSTKTWNFKYAIPSFTNAHVPDKLCIFPADKLKTATIQGSLACSLPPSFFSCELPQLVWVSLVVSSPCYHWLRYWGSVLVLLPMVWQEFVGDMMWWMKLTSSGPHAPFFTYMYIYM